MRERRPRVRPHDVLGGEGEPLSVQEQRLPAHEPSQPNLGALEVLHDRDRVPPARLRVANGPDDLGVLLVSTVGEVQPDHVHAGGDHPVEHLAARAGGSDRTDDLGAPHAVALPVDSARCRNCPV
jgi:hypothetical protein